MLKNVKCARCVKCGKEYEAVPNLTNCECGGILDIIYDYDYIKANLTKEKLKSRPNTMWRYRELLPVEETTPDTPLRVGWSPLYEEDRLAKLLGLKKLWVKDDGQNPTRVPQGPCLRYGGRQGEGGGRGDHRLLVHGQRGLVAGRQRRRRGSQDLHLRSLPRPQGQGRAADDLRRERHFRAGQL